MVTNEENIANLWDAETRLAIGESGKITGTKYGDWHSYQKRDGKLHWIMLIYTDVIPVLHTKFLSVTQAL